jgi:hypothetical protein
MRGVWCVLVGLVALATLAGCKSSWFAEREPWRREAEEQCLKSGAVKESPAVAMLRPIQGPGVCGADFPLKVVALGEGGEALGYAQDLRPPGAIPQGASAPSPSAAPYPRSGVTSTPLSSPASQPNYPSYSPPPSYPRPAYDPVSTTPARQSSPLSLDPSQGSPNAPTYYPSVEREPLDPARGDGSYPRPYQQRPYDAPRASDGSRDIMRDEPDDGVVREDNMREAYPRSQPQRQSYPPHEPRYGAPATTAPTQSPRMGTVPPLGPSRRPIQTTATVSPAATLACPIVSALDAWIKDSVQPSAQRWFNQPVVEIRQISAYSCRGMNGQPGARISEHAFGNALDIASFVLADGRKVTVKDGWRGSPEQQGFLRDIQAAACEQFTTVLAPGSNAFHYDHIHVDLMRRSSGRRICQPGAVSGEEVAARAARNGTTYARQQDRNEPPRREREMVDPTNDPFAWRGGSRRDLPTGSIDKRAPGKQAKPPRRSDPVDDEDILGED